MKKSHPKEIEKLAKKEIREWFKLLKDLEKENIIKLDYCPCCKADIQPTTIGSRERRSDFAGMYVSRR